MPCLFTADESVHLDTGNMDGGPVPPSIHVFLRQSKIYLHQNKAIIVPSLFYDHPLPVFVTFYSNGDSWTWKIPSAAIAELDLGTDIPVLFVQSSPLPCTQEPERATQLPRPDLNNKKMIRLYVEDEDPNVYAWHVFYVQVCNSLDKTASHPSNLAKDYNSSCTICIYSRNLMPFDAVGNFCFALYNTLNKSHDVVLRAHDFLSTHAGSIESILVSNDNADEIVFYNYSITDNFFPFIANLKRTKKILYYHNVTPGFWFSSCFPEFAELLDAAVTQYPLFSQFDAVIANSQFSLDQIRPYLRPDAETLVFPPYFSLSRVQGAEVPVPAEFSARHALLWVGRITPHKRPELALRIADELVRSGVDISLTFVGGGRYDFPAFAQHLQACLEDLAPRTRERIRFLEGLTDEQLTWLYRHSDLLLCTSAHEGYCMPLAEAAACGLPVAAMPQPAVLETLNGGGIVLSEHPAGAAGQIATFLETADEAERRASIPVLKPLPTDALLRLIIGEK